MPCGKSPMRSARTKVYKGRVQPSDANSTPQRSVRVIRCPFKKHANDSRTHKDHLGAVLCLCAFGDRPRTDEQPKPVRHLRHWQEPKITEAPKNWAGTPRQIRPPCSNMRRGILRSDQVSNDDTC